MARNVRIEDIDLGWEQIAGNLLSMNGAYVEVGIFPEAGSYPDGPTVAEVAAFNEFGTATAPARPFLRDTYERLQGSFANDAQKVFEAVADNKITPDQGLQMIGSIQATAVKKTINEWTDPPNSPSTIAAKGKNDPLVDTRKMRDNVQFKKKLGGGRA